MRERRKFPRVNLELKLKVYDDEKLTRLRAHGCVITNIGKTGISFITHEKFEVGQQFYMQFELMGGLQVVFLGELYWKRGSRMLFSYGVKYIKLSWLSQRNLEKGLLSLHFPKQKTNAQVVLEYFLLILLVVLLSRFLNQLPLAYTIGIFLSFVGVFYFIMLRTRGF